MLSVVILSVVVLNVAASNVSVPSCFETFLSQFHRQHFVTIDSFKRFIFSKFSELKRRKIETTRRSAPNLIGLSVCGQRFRGWGQGENPKAMDLV
jgi:hypothetical protein